MSRKPISAVASLPPLLLMFCLVVIVALAPALPALEAEAQAGQVTLDGTATTGTASSGTSVSFSHTTGTGADRLLLVGVSYNSNTAAVAISSVTFTYGSTELALSQVISRKYASNFRYAAIYSLVDPPSGEAGTVKVTFSASVGSGIVAGAASFAGVDTITPLGTPKGADASSSAIAVTLTGLAGDELVFDDVFVGGTSTTATVGAGQSQLWNAFISPARGTASTEQATGSSVTMDWTLGASGIWVSVAVPIYPACSGPRYTLTAGNDGHGTVALDPAGGSYCGGRTVTLTPVPNSGYLFSGWVGADAGDIVNTAGVYTIVMDGDKSIAANFVPQGCSDVSLSAVDDTYLSAAATTTNYGNAATLQVDQTTGNSRRTALLRWDLSSIPGGASISSAGIQVQVTDSSAIAYPLYDLTRAWVEGNGTAGSGADWTTYDGVNNWGTAGASGTTGSVDRGITNLWSSTTSSFSTTGSKTVSLNADGLALVQQWVAGASNNGVIIQQYSGSTSNNLIFESAESTTEANRPKLNLNYCLPNNAAPGQPTLVSPTPDGATGVGTSPTLEVTVTDPDGNATDVTFHGREVGAGSWQDLGTAYAVASGANATQAWPGLEELTQYEWYVTVDDGVASTTGATWSFTTSGPDTFTLEYAAGTGGHLTGEVSQVVPSGGDGTAVTAVPNTGYHFVKWSDDSTANPRTDTNVTANVDVTAEFAVNTFALTYAAGPGGELQGDVSQVVEYGQSGTAVTAVPYTGYHFVKWSDDSTDNPRTDTNVTANVDVTAQFAETCYALTLGHTGSGTTPTAAPTNSDSCPAGQYVAGEDIELSGATADPGWGIAGWSGTADDASKASTNSVTMPAGDHAVGVTYLRLLGDVDSDGDADSTDALIVLTADAGLDVSAYCPMNYGDANGDGVVNSTDALVILTHDAGITVPFPVGQPVAPPVLTTQPPACIP